MNNIERIDVLAVMDAEIARSANLPTAADPYVIERHHVMVDARAAVAELIGFAEGMRELLSQDGAPVWAAGALDQLQSVLARVQAKTRELMEPGIS